MEDNSKPSHIDSNDSIISNIEDKEFLKHVYGEQIFSILEEINNTQNTFNNYIDKTSKEINKKSTNFCFELQSYIKNQVSKYKEVFNLNEKPNKENNIKDSKNVLIQSISHELIQQIKKILTMHSQIFESIKQNIDIMLSFFDISKNLDNKKSIQEFLKDKFNDIIKCWLFLKIDLEKFNFTEALNKSDLDENFKNFVSQICLNKNFVMKISFQKNNIDENGRINNSDEKIQQKKYEYKKMISKNEKNLVKLRMENIDVLDDYIKGLTFSKMINFYLDNATAIKDIKFLSKMPNLEKLTINSFLNMEINIL